MLTPTVWLILGAIFIVLEITVISGIGFLFAGLSAICLGGFMIVNFVTTHTLADQIAYFFFLTIIWGVALWKPLKKLSNKNVHKYKNLSGTEAVVLEEGGLQAGRVGNVKWSGSILRAQIEPLSSVASIAKGETVWVHGQHDGVLLVDTVKPEHK